MENCVWDIENGYAIMRILDKRLEVDGVCDFSYDEMFG